MASLCNLSGSGLLLENNPLPNGYTRVDYIRNASSDISLNTGIKATQDIYMHITFKMDNVHTWPNIFSAHTRMKVDDVCCMKVRNQSKLSLRFGTIEFYYNTLSPFDKHTVEILNKKVYIDNEEIIDGSSEPDFTSAANIVLFTGWNNNNSTQFDNNFYSRGNIWELQINDHVFVPCFNSSNRYGLYDLKGGNFLYNNALTGGYDAT